MTCPLHHRGVSEDATGAAGLLSIRAWTDDGQFRARIRLTTDLARPHEAVSVARSPEQVQAIVAAWLDMLLPATRTASTASQPVDE